MNTAVSEDTMFIEILEVHTLEKNLFVKDNHRTLRKDTLWVFVKEQQLLGIYRVRQVPIHTKDPHG